MEGLMKWIRKNFSWCKIPFTYGEEIHLKNIDGEVDEDRNNSSSQTYNGMISSVQLFIILIAISSSMTTSALLSDHFDPTISLLTLTAYMTVGCFIMVLLHIHRDVVLACPVDMGSADAKRDNLTLLGISIFYIFSCIMDVFQIVASIGCIDVWRCYGNVLGYSYFAFHIARVVYLGGETLFCINFNKSTFLDRNLTRYAFIFLQAANLSLWFDAMVHESITSTENHPLLFSNTSHAHSQYGPNVSEHVVDCINFNTSVYQMANKFVSPAFLPLTIEFTLLVGECFAHWFFTCWPSNLRQSNNSSLDIPLRHENTSDPKDTRSCDYLVRMHCFVGDEIPDSQTSRCERTVPTRQELIDLSSVASEIFGDIAYDREDTAELTPLLTGEAVQSPRAWRLIRIVSPLWLLFVISINLLLCIFALLYKLKREDEKQNTVASSLLGSVWFSLTLATAFAYFVTRSYRSVQQPFSGLEYLLVWSSFGPIAHCFFNSIAAADLNHHGSGTSVRVQKYGVTVETFVFLQLLNVLQIYFQLSFTMYAGRLVVNERMRSTWSLVVLRGLVLYMAVTNGFLWVIGSIHSFDFGQLKGVKERYFGRVGWRVVNNVVSPLLLFFRFNSCLLLTRTYRRLRKPGM